MSKKLLSKRFYNFKKFANKNKSKYLRSKPFPHIVIKNFFKKKFLEEVLNEFPDLQKINSSSKYNNKNEIKFAHNDKKNFTKNIKLIFDYLNSKNFLIFLQRLSSINEKLLPDPNLSGGGLHEIKRGGVLKVHTDFSKHPFKNLDRRLNILIYLNKRWKKNYGGELELWDKDMKRCVKKIKPDFNTMVIFSTNDYTNHGHPNPLNCPKLSSRKSLATYYFSKGRPINETKRKISKNTTLFKNRYGFKNDVIINENKIKNFLRNFQFYQSLKSFEKKFLRSGKTQKKRIN